MMAKHIGWSAAALAGAAMVLASVPAQARPVYMKLGDIKGESATARDHDKWIEILSMRLAPDQPASGGVQVATGDVNGDGAADRTRDHHSSDASAGKGNANERAAGVGGGAMPSVKGKATIADPEPVPAGLLLPAIQKIREAKARASLTSCQPGQRLPPVAVRNSADGKTGRILDATLTACAADEVSFTFQKIEWD